MKNKNVIEVSGLSVQFGDRKVLSEISFTAEKGKITVILGGSGSGKTTSLKHILGLYPITEGSIKVLGTEMSDIQEDDQKQLYLKIGVMYQNGALLNSLTVAENIALPLQQHTNLQNSMIETLVRLKLKMVNLENAYELYPAELSGGMLKRASIARAIIMDPPLLFCDEPGSGLDPVSLAGLDELLINLKEQLGITVVMVTHDVSSILRIADKIIFLEHGNVIYEGPAKAAVNSDVPSVKDFFYKAEGH